VAGTLDDDLFAILGTIKELIEKTNRVIDVDDLIHDSSSVTCRTAYVQLLRGTP
jgi:hypothetical protein